MPYILDYHILATTYDEGLIRQIRNGDGRRRASRVETSKGEAWPGQHEINFRYADALRWPTTTSSTRTARRRSRTQNGCSITFMAKPFDRGSGRRATSTRRSSATASLRSRDDPVLFDRFLAGLIACFKELAIFLAPTINSYKRYAAGSWAPTTLAWGHDNRTCGFRIVGHGAARRVETRIPGGDVNPYLAFAAMIAAGLHGIENELELPPAPRGERVRVERRALPVAPARGDRWRSRSGRPPAPRSATRWSTTT